MHATHWLIGCTLCVASVAAAATSSAETQNLDSVVGTATDAASLHEGGAANSNDVFGWMHDDSQRSAGSESPAGAASRDERPVSAPAAPAAHHPPVGWQSLLPGSIQ